MRLLLAKTILPGLVFAHLVLAPPASADTSAFTAPASLTTGVVFSGLDCCNLGGEFTLNNSMTVDALGLYDLAGIPAAGDTIALYNGLGNLLTSATVTPADSVVDGYFHQSVTPLVLAAGTYTVDEFGTSGDWGFGAAPSTAAGVTWVQHDYSFDTTLTFPTSTSGAAGGPGDAYYGGDVFFGSGTTTTVPEPSAVVLLLTVLLAVALVLRKRTRIEVRAEFD